MKRYLLIATLILSSLTLFGCVQKFPYMDGDLSRETWERKVETNPSKWMLSADNWFLTGDQNMTEKADRYAPPDAVISTMVVNVPDYFTNIKVDGAFQVQIYGTDEHNAVYVFGPNSGVRNAAVDVRGNTLYVRQMQPAPLSLMRHVIVRIGVRDLGNLVQRGCGSIEAVQIRSHGLSIASTPMATGNIYLAGRMSVRRIIQAGRSSINVFGANAPNLDISTYGSGMVNVAGNIGIRSIFHRGVSDINIIGANSDSLKIDAAGSGKIGIKGPVNIKEITARNKMRVYAYPLISNNVRANLFDEARVGLAGHTNVLTVDTYNQSRFEGRDLCALNAFIRAHDTSHINFTASRQIFVFADQHSSIYFFGPEALLSQFNRGDGLIIATGELGGRSWCNYYSEYRPYSYTYMHVPRAQPTVRVDYKGEG